MNIIYEDEDILVINKPAGLLVHPGDYEGRGEEETLVNELIRHDPKIKDAVLDPNNPISRQRPGIVHRLDRDTSGLLLVAKSPMTLIQLQHFFQEGKVKKIYQALLFGKIDREVVENKITRSKRSDRVMMISRDKTGRLAKSEFIPSQYYQYKNQNLTLCDVEIKTGRTHQIRIQAIHLNQPIIGDQMYFSKPSKRLSDKLNISRQMLHAYYLSFPQPRTGEKLSFKIELPEDFQISLNQLKKL